MDLMDSVNAGVYLSPGRIAAAAGLGSSTAYALYASTADTISYVPRRLSCGSPGRAHHSYKVHIRKRWYMCKETWASNRCHSHQRLRAFSVTASSSCCSLPLIQLGRCRFVLYLNLRCQQLKDVDSSCNVPISTSPGVVSAFHAEAAVAVNAWRAILVSFCIESRGALPSGDTALGSRLCPAHRLLREEPCGAWALASPFAACA